MTNSKNILVYDVSEELHRRFKVFCAGQGISMSQAIKAFMQSASSETILPSKKKLIISSDGSSQIIEGQVDEAEGETQSR